MPIQTVLPRCQTSGSSQDGVTRTRMTLKVCEMMMSKILNIRQQRTVIYVRQRAE